MLEITIPVKLMKLRKSVQIIKVDRGSISRSEALIFVLR